MGVTGTGKSAVAKGLATGLGWEMVEGDDYHSPGSLAKLSAGEPLNDEDRAPWLAMLGSILRQRTDAGTSTVLTCSALRRSYRDLLRHAVPDGQLFFVHLDADVEVLAARLDRREGHFMAPSLLSSQCDALEELGPDETGAVVDVSGPLDGVVASARAAVESWRADR
jgi:gluconokinase